MNLTAAVLTTAALACADAQAANHVITFDDLSAPVGAFSAAVMPAGYRGYNWSEHWTLSQASANWFTGVQAHSGTNFGWEGGANPMELVAANGGVFDFVSFWGRDGSGVDTITAHGFRSGAETSTRTFTVTDVYALVTLNFIGIDRLVIDAPSASTGITNLLVDDITVSAVPEAPMALMWLGGLAAFGMARAARGRSPERLQAQRLIGQPGGMPKL